MLTSSVMIKPASGNCNMACSYCFYNDEQKNRETFSFGFMELPTLNHILQKIISETEYACSFTFQGGEPTLAGLDFFQKVVELQQLYNKKKIQIHNSLQTNGLCLDEEWCKFLKKHQFLVGISIDGTKETHDRFRKTKGGKPTFEQIEKTVRLLDKYQVDYNILTVVNKAVKENIRDIYAFYKEKHWNYQQYIPCLNPLDQFDQVFDYTLTPEDYGEFLAELFSYWFEDLKNGTHPYIRSFENYITILLGQMPEACDQMGHCNLQYAIEADGSVYPCDFFMMDEYKLGDINRDSIADIDQKRTEIQFIENSCNLDPECKKCSFFPVCRGGCQRNRVPLEGSYRSYLCAGYKVFFEKCLPTMLHIAERIRENS